MKNKLAIYFSVLAMMFVASSCFNSDNDDSNNPYAYIKTFSIGDIQSSFPAFTETGEDTTVVRTIAGAGYPFVINQSGGEIYNNDSLPFAIDVTKVVISMTVEGVATMFDEETGAYEYFTLEDSIDFTAPRKFRVTSLDGTYSKDYTVSVNAHQVEPDMMVWNRFGGVPRVTPKKAVERDGKMYIFGNVADGTPALMTVSLGSDVVWDTEEYLVTLPTAVDFTTLHLFNGKFYVLAEGDLYVSADAVTWETLLQGGDLLAIMGASDTDGAMWLANADSVFCSDGAELDTIGALPKDFPLFAAATFSYPLSHNKNIIRYMYVGYTTTERDGNPKVWSMLSNEDTWVEYANVNNPYPCPALDGLAVVRYDNFLYALGGKGCVGGEDVEPFASFYISKDNGIVWKAPSGYYQLLPEELKDVDVPFVVATDSDNYMWIITADESIGVWKGIINRLGFKK